MIGTNNNGGLGQPPVPPHQGYGPPEGSYADEEGQQERSHRRNTRDDTTTESKLRELEEKIRKLSGGGEEDRLEEVISEAERTLFTQELDSRPFPPKCTFPLFSSKFDGTRDATEHMKEYSMALVPWTNHEVVMCNFFPDSLEGEARKWFYNLPHETIDSYDTLVETFLETYMHNTRPRPRVNKFFTLARRFGESLRSLTDRWRKLCTDIGQAPVEQQIFGFQNSLRRTDPILIAMFTEKPKTMKEMRKIQEHYISLEEIQEESRDRGVQEATVAPEEISGDTHPRPEKRQGPPMGGNMKKEWVPKGKKPRHEAKAYTPLKAPLEEIFKEVEKRNDIIYPASRGVQFKGTKDHPEYCHYHQCRGHATNNCREVKDIVQHLIRDGYLRQFVRQPARAPRAADAPVHQVRIDRTTQFVNTISHSSIQEYTLSPSTMTRIHKRDYNEREIFSVAKDLPMEPWMTRRIYFSAQDVPMNARAHSDSLVITLLIEECGVRRILVDSGSSVEFLFYDTVKRMNLSDDILVPSIYRIYGFSGTVTIPKGELTLRVLDGGGYFDTLTTFCVVDVASPYEAIIGRPWIAGIKQVASAYHQILRFPTYKGISEVVGESQAARQCMEVYTQINEETRSRQQREKNKIKVAKAAEDLEKIISQSVMTNEVGEQNPL